MVGKIKSKIYKKITEIVGKEIAKIEQNLPSLELNQIHFDNLRVLKNRESLLNELPKNGIVAELGVDKGGFSQMILEINHPQKLHLIDSWNTERYHSGLKIKVEERFSKEISNESVVIHQGFSTDFAENFPNSYFDWIYIDTDHSYQTTKNELLLYKDKIKPGGIIAGHDFVKGNMQKQIRYGVLEAVYEFCFNENWEFVFLTMEMNNNPSFAIRKI
ncbi:MAG: class I SAM-dependent methyltransferase [Flavobacteriaceae bacterium]|nr:class I SAM-dependent methyltransferase [Flavobacteriaceae bacterium]